jgi:uncharacterized protein (TIGR03435 family)
VRRRIVDDTRLSGSFDVILDWSNKNDDLSGPSIFTAVREQLGLRLESDRGSNDHRSGLTS